MKGVVIHDLPPIQLEFVAWYAIFREDENGKEYPEWHFEWRLANDKRSHINS